MTGADVTSPAEELPRLTGRRAPLALAGFLLALFLVAGFAGVPAASAAGTQAASQEAEQLRAGERLYRSGILPSGAPVTAIVQGDLAVDGTMFSCQSCHMRGGFGSFEGGVVTTPTTGKYLYQPVFTLRQLSAAEKETIPRYFRAQYDSPPKRPAYTDATLAYALREGIDPAGRKLSEVMPRYPLNDGDMAVLIGYLKSLSAETPPGVGEETVKFASVVTPDVTAAEREALFTTLENYAKGRNNMARASAVRAKRGFLTELMDVAYKRQVAVVRWELKGAPESWRGQLEELYRKEPVFALLGGMSHGEWRPIHQFSEEHQLPCLLPITDYPVISDRDWYTVYFSKGFYQEGEAAARHLAAEAKEGTEERIVQLYRDDLQGRAFAEGFRAVWRELGRPAPAERTLKPAEPVTGGLLESIAGESRNTVLLVWLGDEAVPALQALAGGKRPAAVYLSGSLLRQGAASIPEAVRDFTYLTYPQAFATARAQLSGMEAPQYKAKGGRSVSNGTFALWVVLNDALMMLGTNFYRDNFLDKVDMIQDKYYPYTDYERLSFGPGQRYASKGCYILQVGHGAQPELIRKSDWVIH